MASETRRSLQRAVQQLEAQRRRYELAVEAAEDARIRDRHRRNVARLDDEIAAHEEALATLISSPHVAIAQRHPDAPRSEPAAAYISGAFARLELDGTFGLDRGQLARLVAIAFAAGFLLVAFAVIAAR